MLDRKCERPFLPKHRELLVGFLSAAISLDPIWRCHSRSHALKLRLHKTRVAPLPEPRRGVTFEATGANIRGKQLVDGQNYSCREDLETA
jgi:hypothetical protein